MSERAKTKSAVTILETETSFLLERRPNLPGELAYPNKLQLFGGGREQGEDGAVAAARELSEELGLVVTPDSFVEYWVGEYIGEDKNGAPTLRDVSVYYLGLTAAGRSVLEMRVQGELAEIDKTNEVLDDNAGDFTPFALRMLREFLQSKKE